MTMAATRKSVYRKHGMAGHRTKDLVGAVMPSTGLGDRQIRVVVSTPSVDRVGDILEPGGCVLTNFKKNPIVLADHDRTQPIGTAQVFVKAASVEAVITFAPEGASTKADQYCRLTKSGVVNCVSPGFVEKDVTPLQGGGYHIKQWELLEISLVAVPCNPEAVVTQRSFSGATQKMRAAEISRLERIAEISRLAAETVPLSKSERLARIAALEAQGNAQLGDLPEPLYARFRADQIVRDTLKRSSLVYGADPVTQREERLRQIEQLRRMGNL